MLHTARSWLPTLLAGSTTGSAPTGANRLGLESLDSREAPSGLGCQDGAPGAAWGAACTQADSGGSGSSCDSSQGIAAGQGGQTQGGCGQWLGGHGQSDSCGQWQGGQTQGSGCGQWMRGDGNDCGHGWQGGGGGQGCGGGGGQVAPATISGVVYADAAQTGIYSSTDAGLSGSTVTLTGTNYLGQSVTLTTTSGANGSYSFTGLQPGTYSITYTATQGDSVEAAHDNPTGTVATAGQVSNIVVASGASVTINLPEVPPSTLPT